MRCRSCWRWEGFALAHGATDLTLIVQAQRADGLATWGVAAMPLLALAALLALQAMLGKEPFEIYIAPAEIATGPMVEMSGKYLGALFVMQCFQLYTLGALYTTVFLGGGATWPEFLVKVFAVILVAVSLTNVYARFRTEDVIRWQWTWPTVLGLVMLE